MLSDTIVVQSAMSAFNNAALMGPAFFWLFLLMVPLFFGVYVCGDYILQKFHLEQKNILNKITLVTISLSLLWVVLFSGNYIVLRDSISLLPFIIAVFIFFATLFIARNTNNTPIPRWRTASPAVKTLMASTIALIFVVFGLSDIHTWWGPLLPILAVTLGFVFGRKYKKHFSSIPYLLGIVLFVIVLLLMQPEFFRFGQLGSLSMVHLLFLIIITAVITAILALHCIKVSGKIRNNCFAKLKWLLRLIACLFVVVFVLTESVLVFIAMVIAFFGVFAISVWHSKILFNGIKEKLLSVLLCLFGIITVMPVITSMGILYWISLPKFDFFEKIKFLL